MTIPQNPLWYKVITLPTQIKTSTIIGLKKIIRFVAGERVYTQIKEIVRFVFGERLYLTLAKMSNIANLPKSRL